MIIKLIERHEAANTILRSYLCSISASNATQMRGNIDGMTSAIAAICDAAFVVIADEPPPRYSVWVCVDRAGAMPTQGDTYALSSFDILIERSCRRREVAGFACTVAIFQPANFDWLKDGRRSFANRMARLFIDSWQQALGTLPHPLGAALKNTRAWICGNPREQMLLGSTGEPIVSHETLPLSEERFFSGKAYLGIEESGDDADFEAFWNEISQ